MPQPAPPQAPRERVVYTDTADGPYAIPVGATRDVKRIGDALFKKHLVDLADCPKPTSEPHSWVQVDERQEENFKAGLFVPRFEQRIYGSFSEPNSTEALFVIQIENCQQSDSRHYVLAVVDEDLGKPLRSWNEHPRQSKNFLAVIPLSEPSRLLEAVGPDTYRLVQLGRPFTSREPWVVLQEWTRRDCHVFYLAPSGALRLDTLADCATR